MAGTDRVKDFEKREQFQFKRKIYYLLLGIYIKLLVAPLASLREKTGGKHKFILCIFIRYLQKRG